MATIELIETLCEINKQLLDIVHQQDMLLEMHGIKTVDLQDKTNQIDKESEVLYHGRY